MLRMTLYEALHERRLRPNLCVCTRGSTDGWHEHRGERGLDLALDRPRLGGGRDRGVSAVEVENGICGDKEDVCPAQC